MAHRSFFISQFDSTYCLTCWIYKLNLKDALATVIFLIHHGTAELDRHVFIAHLNRRVRASITVKFSRLAYV